MDSAFRDNPATPKEIERWRGNIAKRALTRTMTLSRVISTGFQTLHVQMRLLLWSF